MRKYRTKRTMTVSYLLTRVYHSGPERSTADCSGLFGSVSNQFSPVSPDKSVRHRSSKYWIQRRYGVSPATPVVLLLGQFCKEVFDMEEFLNQSDKEPEKLTRKPVDEAPAPLDEWEWAELLAWVDSELKPATERRGRCSNSSRSF